MPTFHLLNFGCRASQADGAAIKLQLLRQGLVESPRAEECEVAVLNTCTVTAAADAEVRQVIRRIRRANPGCRIMVTGCYAQRASEEIAALPGVEWVVGNSHKHLIADLLGGVVDARCGIPDSASANQTAAFRILNAEASVPSPPSRIPNPEPRARIFVGEIAEEFHFSPVFADDSTRPTLKVQDGCDARCAFCIIPEVRGPSRSMAPGAVVAQVLDLEQRGYQEIVLSGINLGSYGKDLDRRVTFLDLLEILLSKTSIPRIRISSIEPMDVSPALIRMVASEPRMARHFHIPLQSGCDRILRAMNRRYWAGHYAERIWAVHEQIPNCGIGADVMVGFPGETDEDHRISLKFVASLPFTYLHVFPYSLRPGTAAAGRPGHLNGRIIQERGQEMRAVIQPKRQAFLASQLGRDLSAVTLSEEENGARVALSTNYLKLLLPESGVAANSLVNVRVGRELDGLLYGYVASSAAARGSPAGLK
jgi:threonylcarbamoyladenosine tRNA methylthiotransferase MtaB